MNSVCQFTFIHLIVVTTLLPGFRCRFSRGISQVVVVKADTQAKPDSDNQLDEASYQGRGASMRRQRASPGQPSRFYEQFVTAELERLAGGNSSSVPTSVATAARKLLGVINKGFVDLEDVVKHFPSLLREEQGEQFKETMKILRIYTFTKGGGELSRYINVILKYLRGNELEPPGENDGPARAIDRFIEYLRLFVGSIYEALGPL